MKKPKPENRILPILFLEFNDVKFYVRNVFLLTLLSFALKSPAQIQDVKFSLVTGMNGISLGKINSMVQDKYGFLWLSDQTNGCIIRYSGSQMTRYQHDPKNVNSLGGYYPECLYADSSGNISDLILWDRPRQIRSRHPHLYTLSEQQEGSQQFEQRYRFCYTC